MVTHMSTLVTNKTFINVENPSDFQNCSDSKILNDEEPIFVANAINKFMYILLIRNDLILMVLFVTNVDV